MSNTKKGILITIGIFVGFFLLMLLPNIIKIVPVGVKEYAKEGIILENYEGRLPQSAYINEEWYDIKCESNDDIIIEDGIAKPKFTTETQVYNIKLTFYYEGDYKEIGTLDSTLTINPFYYYAKDIMNEDGWRKSSDGKTLAYSYESSYSDSVTKVNTEYSYDFSFSFETRIAELKYRGKESNIKTGKVIYDNYHTFYNLDTKTIYDDEGNSVVLGNTYDHTYFTPSADILSYVRDVDKCYKTFGLDDLVSGLDGNTNLYPSLSNENGSVTCFSVSYSDRTAEIYKGSILNDDYVIPNYYRGLKITTICKSAFESNVKCTTLVIPEGVEIIEDYAFKNAQIEVLVLPSTIKEINEGAFYNSSIKTIIFTNNVKPYISSGAFNKCSNLETKWK